MRRLFVVRARQPIFTELRLNVAAKLRQFFPQSLDLVLLSKQDFVHLLQVPLLVHEGFLDGDEFVARVLFGIGHESAV